MLSSCQRKCPARPDGRGVPGTAGGSEFQRCPEQRFEKRSRFSSAMLGRFSPPFTLCTGLSQSRSPEWIQCALLSPNSSNPLSGCIHRSRCEALDCRLYTLACGGTKIPQPFARAVLGGQIGKFRGVPNLLPNGLRGLRVSGYCLKIGSMGAKNPVSCYPAKRQ